MRARVPAFVAIFLLVPTLLTAQSAAEVRGPWSLRVRAVMSGTSYESQPEGYQIYSGFGLEAALVRHVSEVVDLEISLRTESREVEGPRDGGVEHRLGRWR